MGGRTLSHAADRRARLTESVLTFAGFKELEGLSKVMIFKIPPVLLLIVVFLSETGLTYLRSRPSQPF